MVSGPAGRTRSSTIIELLIRWRSLQPAVAMGGIPDDPARPGVPGELTVRERPAHRAGGGSHGGMGPQHAHRHRRGLRRQRSERQAHPAAGAGDRKQRRSHCLLGLAQSDRESNLECHPVAASSGYSAPRDIQLTALKNLFDNFPQRSGVGVSGIDFFEVPGVARAADRRTS